MGGTGWHITVTECQLEFCMYIMKLKEGWEEEGWGRGVEGGGVGVEECREVIYTILQQYNTKP